MMYGEERIFCTRTTRAAKAVQEFQNNLWRLRLSYRPASYIGWRPGLLKSLKTPSLNKNILYRRNKPNNNEGRTPFICRYSLVPIHLSFNIQHGPPLSIVSLASSLVLLSFTSVCLANSSLPVSASRRVRMEYIFPFKKCGFYKFFSK